MTEEKPDGIQTTEDEPTKLGSCGLRETRTEGDTGREKHGQWEMRAGKRKTEDGKKNGRREERRKTGRKTEDGKKDGAKSDAAKTDRTAESGGKKNRPAQPQARRHGPKAGIQYLFLLAQNTHRNVENRRIVQRNHASVRPRLEVDTHAFFRLVFPSEIVADSVYIDS